MCWSEPYFPQCSSVRRLFAPSHLCWRTSCIWVFLLVAQFFLRLANHLGGTADFLLCLWLLLFFSYFTPVVTLLLVIFHAVLFSVAQTWKMAPWWPFPLQSQPRQRIHFFCSLRWCFSCSWDSPWCHFQHHHLQPRGRFTACSLLLLSVMWGEGKGGSFCWFTHMLSPGVNYHIGGLLEGDGEAVFLSSNDSRTLAAMQDSSRYDLDHID